MYLNRVALGFDLRVDVGAAAQEWTPVPESQLLVQRETPPIGADPCVWVRPEPVDRLAQRNWCGGWNPLGLGTSLGAMLQACESAGVATKGMIRTALTSSVSNSIVLIERYGPGWFEELPTEDALLSEGWALKGFDLVDLRGLISGLTGCGYRSDSVLRLRETFCRFLNEDGLFLSEAVASQFGETRGMQIPDHAPFVVVGVLVKELDGDV